MYLLDTNICIYAINGKHPVLTKRLLTVHPDDICISAITVGELEYGAAKSAWGEKNRRILQAFLANYRILPFSGEDAVHFGRIRSYLEEKGTPIGAYDLQIAAQGISGNHTVVTHNTKEFTRVPGMILEDWLM